VKLILKDDTHEYDPEGLIHAEALNEHLPADICAFAVQVGDWGGDCTGDCSQVTAVLDHKRLFSSSRQKHITMP
jgi:hypothetical protein